ncbi:hypothetical protein LVJ94_32195 [Pendulispora rubella]|uniref:Sugar-binding domain-containing protein n=1 Tax=Pendulispora rubella TaxID=2741070 RepID=A0ABZ2KSD3_9BACT
MSKDDFALEARAAWLYYKGGLTQGEVAEKLGVSSVRVHRLIARAATAGIVKITVQGSITECVALEEEIKRLSGVPDCRVVPELADPGDPFRAIGAEAAEMLSTAIESGVHAIIGLGHGRSIASAIDQLPQLAPGSRLSIVSLLGGVPHQRRASTFDVIYRLAGKTGAEAWVMPVPLFADTSSAAHTIAAQRSIAETLRLGAESSLSLVGIGEVTGTASLLSAHAIEEDDARALRAAGAVGEILGHYYDAEGHPIDGPIAKRVIAVPPKTLSRGLVAMASGAQKIAAIASILATGHLKGLITDEPTATALVAFANRAKPAKRKGASSKGA